MLGIFAASMSQCSPVWKTGTIYWMTAEFFTDIYRLNVVRSGRPKQLFGASNFGSHIVMSQCSPVWKTGTIRQREVAVPAGQAVSM